MGWLSRKNLWFQHSVAGAVMVGALGAWGHRTLGVFFAGRVSGSEPAGEGVPCQWP